MQKRNILRNQLISAWERTLTVAYPHRLINSERGLQAHFCAELLREFGQNSTRSLFVEPCITFEDGKKRHPDLVICNRDRIIGVVELKYRPNGRPDPSKDIETLFRFAESPALLSLSNERYRGPTKPKAYPLAPDAILCWAGIYKGAPMPLLTDKISKLGRSILRLDATTSKSSNPQPTSADE